MEALKNTDMSGKPGMRFYLPIALTITLIGCAGNSPGPVIVSSLDLSPLMGIISVGESVQLIAVTRDADGKALTQPAVAWSTSSATVATVSPSGLVTGVSPGMVGISATADGQTATASMTVSDLGIGFGPEQFAMVPAGTFEMGETPGLDNVGGANERPAHTVRITKPFSMQRTEVTQGQWETVMGTKPSFFKTCGDTCPVDQVSWLDIQDFLMALNTMDPGKDYRLPTEAEWEYACRAGTTGNWGGTGVLDEMGWHPDNSGGQTHRVARKLPNHWGLFDMHGNVSEWVQDWYSSTYYSSSPENDPAGPASGQERVVRGGNVNPALAGHSGAGATASGRGSVPPYLQVRYLGFRIARNP